MSHLQMQQTFDRAESLLAWLGEQPELIAPAEEWRNAKERCAGALGATDELSRGPSAVFRSRLTHEHLAQLTADDRQRLEQSFEELLVFAEAVRVKARLPREHFDDGKHGLLRTLVNSSSTAQYVGSILSSQKDFIFRGQAVADLALATLRAFVACRPLIDLFTVNDYTLSKSKVGLESLQGSLMSAEHCADFVRLADQLGFGVESSGRNYMRLALVYLLPHCYERQHGPGVTAALAAITAAWIENAPLTEWGASADAATRLERLLIYATDELTQISQWLTGRPQPQAAGASPEWLVGELSTIGLHITGW